MYGRDRAAQMLALGTCIDLPGSTCLPWLCVCDQRETSAPGVFGGGGGGGMSFEDELLA